MLTNLSDLYSQQTKGFPQDVSQQMVARVGSMTASPHQSRGPMHSPLVCLPARLVQGPKNCLQRQGWRACHGMCTRQRPALFLTGSQALTIQIAKTSQNPKLNSLNSLSNLPNKKLKYVLGFENPNFPETVRNNAGARQQWWARSGMGWHVCCLHQTCWRQTLLRTSQSGQSPAGLMKIAERQPVLDLVHPLGWRCCCLSVPV